MAAMPIKPDSADVFYTYVRRSGLRAVVPVALWVIYTCCAINSLTDDVLDWYVKTLIKATWIDILGESDLFIKRGVSGLDICQSEFVCKVSTAQQLDAEWRGDACQRNILVIDSRVSVYMFVPQWGQWNWFWKTWHFAGKPAQWLFVMAHVITFETIT